MTEDIARIEEHELRSVWPHEERDFTKWLTSNIDVLAAELGLEIEEANSEEAVGSFSADIVGKEMNSGGIVVIENQYGPTDHDHLGKLLTYSAGKNAEFTIWLAEHFRPEHRSVLEWLNESGPKDIKFFGIRPRVVSIEGADSKGFEFEVLVEPNDWERDLTNGLSETEQAYKDFFGQLATAYAEHRPNWYKLTPQPQPWLAFGAGRSGLAFVWAFHKGPEFCVELYIDTSDPQENDAIFQTLQNQQGEIEASLDQELVWQHLPEKRACRIKLTQDISGKITELGTVEQNKLVEWGVTRMDAFQDEFENRISEL
ncbi:DUF4268 domain-containing protein [Haladaptatus sp. ZSTT2]|uniref:DUF4268 domain-containing protein n=1 Tax=Haladaptatus sp. ZSTT2 TaxID=3120515 RepID=UPI00300ECB64